MENPPRHEPRIGVARQELEEVAERTRPIPGSGPENRLAVDVEFGGGVSIPGPDDFVGWLGPGRIDRDAELPVDRGRADHQSVPRPPHAGRSEPDIDRMRAEANGIV